MSMSDIKTEIRFGATVAVSAEEIKQSKENILIHRKEQIAQDLGSKIAEAKGWNMRPEGDMIISEMNLYCFTRNELKLFVDAKLKKRMLELAQEDYIDDKTREALKIMAERV